MRIKTVPLVLLFVLPSLPAAAGVLNLQELMSIRQACGDDIKTLCGDTKRGGGQLAQCLVNHADAVSHGCTDALKAAKARLPPTTAGTQLYDTD